MKWHHSITLVFIGWYLMMPPMAAELEPACNQPGVFKTSTLFTSMVAGVSPREYQTLRCNRLDHQVATYAPMAAWPDNMSTWNKIGQFETLVACQAAYDAEQAKPVNLTQPRREAEAELAREGNRSPSEKAVQLRSREIAQGLAAQIAGERCIATDPNLARW